jgi:hypothetical protein
MQLVSSVYDPSKKSWKCWVEDIKLWGILWYSVIYTSQLVFMGWSNQGLDCICSFWENKKYTENIWGGGGISCEAVILETAKMGG